MAKKKKEEVVEQTTEQPKVDNKVEKIKVKKKPSIKKFSNDPDGMIKVDLSKPPEEKENETVQEKVVEESTKENAETPVLEEITDEKVEETVEKLEEQVEEAVTQAEAAGKPIPENIQKHE